MIKKNNTVQDIGEIREIVIRGNFMALNTQTNGNKKYILNEIILNIDLFLQEYSYSFIFRN